MLEQPARTGSRWAGAAAGAATLLLLLVGAGRGYDLDSSLTVGVFVATRSLRDAFTRAFVLNNHVFFSFLDHLVYSATGSQSETTLRLLPIVFTALAVALATGLLSRRFGAVPALAGALVFATNP